MPRNRAVRGQGTTDRLRICLTLVGRSGVVKSTVEYHQPDKSAKAIYSYEDINGKLIKQVLRYAGKGFSQRRLAAGGGWIWNANGIKPMLYNLPRLQFARTICLCEGEKDCDAIMNLALLDAKGADVVATTSGVTVVSSNTFDTAALALAIKALSYCNKGFYLVSG